MMIPKEIRLFRGEYAFLSNFYSCVITHDGIEYRNLESAFQAAKCANLTDRLEFKTLEPSSAKKLGRKIKLRDDWEIVKLSVLTELVRLKFIGNPELLARLMKTGGALLSEDNTWHDNFYGNCTCNRCRNVPGLNNLGLTLMQLRDQLQQQMG